METGFIRNGDNITSQIDIVIYDNSFLVLFSEGDFVITTPENVVSIIEVKSFINSNELCRIIEKTNQKGSIIVGKSDTYIFIGIFSYNSKAQHDNYVENLRNYDFSPLLHRSHFNQIIPPALSYCVNHIALGNRYFLKFWESGQSPDTIELPYYSIYALQEGLAISYFLSNLQDLVIRKARRY